MENANEHFREADDIYKEMIKKGELEEILNDARNISYFGLNEEVIILCKKIINHYRFHYSNHENLIGDEPFKLHLFENLIGDEPFIIHLIEAYRLCAQKAHLLKNFYFEKRLREELYKLENIL